MDITQFWQDYNYVLLVAGLGVLALTTLLHRFDDYPFSFPILALVLGGVVFSLPLGLMAPEPTRYQQLTLHITELGVIISLMGVGLKIERHIGWRNWSATWRLLAITMPLSIAGVAFLGWWLMGLAPAAAVLLGAVLAPTDPVLASDVQVGKPEEPTPVDDDRAPGGTEVRFPLTSEAGLNDALAFPFVWLALLLLSEGTDISDWLGQWLLFEVFYKLAVAVIVGIGVGALLVRVLIRLPIDSEKDQMRAGMGALAATLILYSVTEAVHGYGFLAVFIGAMTIRRHERSHASHRFFHAFAEQSEQLLMTAILMVMGGAIAAGLLSSLTWSAALVACALIFIIRPLAGLVGLFGCHKITWLDRGIISFFGIRGIGSMFYLSFALHQGEFEQGSLLWATVGLAIVLSICIHGITAGPVMRFRDKRHQ